MAAELVRSARAPWPAVRLAAELVSSAPRSLAVGLARCSIGLSIALAFDLVLQGGDSAGAFRTMLKKFTRPADKPDMDQLLEQSPAIQDNRGIESETTLIDQAEILVPIEDYATRRNLSRRTVDRYVQTHRLETLKQHGRTYIRDMPLKPPPAPTGHVRNVTDSQIVLANRSDWIELGYLKAQAKSKTIWQVYAVTLTVLFVALLLVSLWLYLQWQIVK